MTDEGQVLTVAKPSLATATLGLDSTTQSEIDVLLDKLNDGDSSVSGELFSLAYDALHAIAHRHRQRWQGDLTYNTTTILHESYLKLVDRAQADWESMTHFLSVVAKAMRHVLIDYARRRKTLRRGGEFEKVSLSGDDLRLEDRIRMSYQRAEALISLDDAIRKLEEVHPREAEVVQCRFFGGMTIQETAAALGISTATVSRDWAMAQAWLMREMGEEVRA